MNDVTEHGTGARKVSRSVLPRWAAGATAVALALTSAVGFGGVASANVGNIDPLAPVTLTVHKYVQPDVGNLGPNDGTEILAPAGTPLAGVEFTVQRVTSVDLLTNAGWATAGSLTAAAVIADSTTYPLGTAVTALTDGTGEAIFTDLVLDGVGLYLVRETDPGANPIAAPAIPFLVALPLPFGNGTWNYDAHVYPKNALNGITKSVDDSGAYELGDSIEWTVVADVPRLSEGTTYTQYGLLDEFDSRLSYVSVEVVLNNLDTVQPLVRDTHYTETFVEGPPDVVTIAFLPAGLALLNAASPTATVTAVYTTVVDAAGNGDIPNTAEVFVNEPVVSGNGTRSNEPISYWGQLAITKHAEGDVAATLEGAVFDIYAVDPAANPTATPVVIGLTTDVNGEITVDLRVGNYWVVETQAPAGYLLDETPIPVSIVQGMIAFLDVTEADIANEQVPPWLLPLTGGSGTLIFTAGGLALLLLALGALFVTTRRRSNENALTTV